MIGTISTVTESRIGSMSLSPPPTGPPLAARRPFDRTLWSDTRTDHYRWLEERESADVLAHLAAENNYTEALLAPVAALRETLFQEIKRRIKETDLSVAVVKDNWAYYGRTVEGMAYPIHCRRPVPASGPPTGPALIDWLAPSEVPTDEQILLDENAEAAGRDFFDIGIFEVSPDHRWLLWGYDDRGDERFRALLRDLESGKDTDLGLTDLGYGSAWGLDNETFFYLRNDQANRPFEVWRHRIGAGPVDGPEDGAENDVLIYSEPDERFFVGVGREKDDSFIQISVSSKITDEIRVIPADRPETEPLVLAERRDGIEYAVSHHGSDWIILTNDGAENFRVMTAPETDPSPSNWQELIPGSETVTVMDVDVSRSFLILFERADGTTRLRLRRWSDGEVIAVEQPEEVSTSWPGANPDYESSVLRYGYSSMVTPATVFLYDPETGQREVLKQQEVLGGFDPDVYHTERRWAVGHDGVRIPTSMVWHRDRALADPGPCLLYAYGSYEASIDPTFSPIRLSLLERGFVFAIAHVRGGGELGRKWYRGGKLENKPNTFADVESVARMLIDDGVTSPGQLVLRGGSAGGLMAGAVINQSPELFAAVVAQVPFVDVLTTITNAALPLTVTEWEEWGNPIEDEAIYEVMRSYSPLDNVGPRPYPSVLATAGLNDTRVSYWEAAKWVQELRHQTTSGEPILLWTDLESGHGGPSGRYEAWREEARILAYILSIVGSDG